MARTRVLSNGETVRLLPPGLPHREWFRAHCKRCGRKRVHLKTGSTTRCIGALPDGRSERCGGQS